MRQRWTRIRNWIDLDIRYRRWVVNTRLVPQWIKCRYLKGCLFTLGDTDKDEFFVCKACKKKIKNIFAGWKKRSNDPL